ncbi:hypothetical protein B484DRAFT_51752 [Ochromonadaceae sp. CCMP2298]|nr:hypothetical protein B484DRAFT_51752 [Ochromonadaceae sp. CCMP2298]
MGMNFHIYSMGWYVDSEAAQDASLAPFRGAPLHQLRQNEDFFEALAARGDYDRTLFVKLAMTLKTQILLEGFLAEIYLLPKNKAIVAAASAQYTEPVCPQGLEILFSWRKGGGGGDMLEVRIGKMVFALEEPGLAEDFMRQFFSQEPVSPGAKMGFASGFPALLGAQGARAFPIVPPTQPTSAPQAPSAAQSSEDQRQDQRQGLRKRARRFVKDKLRAAERLADKLKAHLQNLDFEPKDGQRWLRHLHFVADQHAPSHGFMEYAASVFVLLYCCLLILLSMPPALLHNGVSSLRRGVGAQRQRLREIKSTLCRSINSSSTLKQLGRTAAEISMG